MKRVLHGHKYNKILQIIELIRLVIMNWNQMLLSKCIKIINFSIRNLHILL